MIISNATPLIYLAKVRQRGLLNKHINDALTHPDKFEVVHQNEDFVLFKVK